MLYITDDLFECNSIVSFFNCFFLPARVKQIINNDISHRQ